MVAIGVDYMVESEVFILADDQVNIALGLKEKVGLVIVTHLRL